jgi:alpha-glucoside transport system substrate-binding protein
MVERVQSAAMTVQAEIPPPPPGLDVRVLASVERERQARRGLGGRLLSPARTHPRLPIRPLALGAALLATLIVALVVVAPSAVVSNGAQAVPITQLPADCAGGTRLVVAGVWQGAEATQFAKVLGRFQAQTGIQVVYEYETRSIATTLGQLIKLGCAPDVAMLPQPGTMFDLARRGALEPLDTVAGDVVRRNYSPAWQQLATLGGHLYGVWFKGAAKSLIWYRPDAFRRAGITQPPRTWPELIADARRLRAVGIQPFAVGGQDGWTLTDWFSNVYLADAGPIRYQELAEHRIRWTDPSVRDALARLATILGDDSLVGPPSVTSKTSFEQSVQQVFGRHPRAAMVFEGDFVRSFLPPGSDARYFAFPTPAPESAPPIEVGGDVAVLLSKSRDAQELIRYLATPTAAESWAKAGGFISPNRALNPAVYPDALTRELASRLVGAPTVAFGLSDQEPPAFGSAAHQGMWLMFQEFLANPSDIGGLMRQLEAGATFALACERAVAGEC